MKYNLRTAFMQEVARYINSVILVLFVEAIYVLGNKRGQMSSVHMMRYC